MKGRHFFLICHNTLQKEVRSKVLLFLMALTIGSLFLSAFLLDHVGKQISSIPEMQGIGNVVLAIFIQGVGLWNFFLSVFLGTQTVRSDIEDHVAPQLLTFPLKRFEYLSARIIGVFLIVTGFYLLSAGLAIGIFWWQEHIKINFSKPYAQSVGQTACPSLATTALSVLLSLYTGKLTSLVTSFSLILFISFTNSYFNTHSLDHVLQHPNIFTLLMMAIHMGLPRIGTFNHIASTWMAEGNDIPLWPELIHYTLSLSFLLFCTATLFKRKDF